MARRELIDAGYTDSEIDLWINAIDGDNELA